jgi:serine/threonine protein kinase
VHCRPRNILVNSNCKLKICDFGLARPFLEGNTPCAWTDYVATRWYRAPELCGCFYGRYSTAVDMWGLGCIFAEVLQGKPLFPGRDAVSQLQLITDLLGKPPPHVIERISNRKARAFLSSMPEKAPVPFASKFPGADPEALQLLKAILQFDASERLTAPEALKLPFFKDLPAANFSDATPITSTQFAFESQQLTESDVRDLIYSEVLNYHPEVRGRERIISYKAALALPLALMS